MALKKITLEDIGQDLLWLKIDELGREVESGPFHKELYKGGFIPHKMLEIGHPCPMHKPPDIEYGFLKYDVEAIEDVEETETTAMRHTAVLPRKQRHTAVCLNKILKEI